MKIILTLALILMVGPTFAATIDVPRVDGVVMIPNLAGFYRMEVDINAPAATCDTIAGGMNDRWRAMELQAATLLGYGTEYQVKTNVICSHRAVTVPAIIIDEAVCDITLTETSTVAEIEAACPILLP